MNENKKFLQNELKTLEQIYEECTPHDMALKAVADYAITNDPIRKQLVEALEHYSEKGDNFWFFLHWVKPSLDAYNKSKL